MKRLALPTTQNYWIGLEMGTGRLRMVLQRRVENREQSYAIEQTVFTTNIRMDQWSGLIPPPRLKWVLNEHNSDKTD